MKHNCDQLGVCQVKRPPCNGCSKYFFAPGVIEGHRARHVKHLVRWIVRAAMSLGVLIIMLAAMRIWK